MLNELDKELERRGHLFVRYADDLVIFCKSRRSAQRTLDNLLPFIETKLFLKVNKDKTHVAYMRDIKFLSYAFGRRNGKCQFYIHVDSIKKMKIKIRELTSRNNGWSSEYRKQRLTWYIRGWLNYFKFAGLKSRIKEWDGWLRHRIRMCIWKSWKRVRTRYRNLKKLIPDVDIRLSPKYIFDYHEHIDIPYQHGKNLHSHSNSVSRSNEDTNCPLCQY